MNRRRGWALLRTELRRHRHRLTPLGAWSAVQALPTLTCGLLIAAAIDRGFLAARPLIGLAWLAAYGAVTGLGVLACQRLLPHQAAVVEPIRDALVDTVVSGALRRGARGPDRPDAAAITHLAVHIQSIRGLLSALLTDVRDVGVSSVAAVVGLALLNPALVALTVVPVLAGLIAFARLQAGLRRRKHAALASQEVIATQVLAGVDGIRDIAACRAQRQAGDRIGAAIEAERRASVDLARGEVSRLSVLAAIADLPILVVLAGATLLIQHGSLTPGQLVGAVAYLTTGLRPAMSTLLGSVTMYGLQLGVTLDRIAVGAEPPAPPRPRRRARGHTLRTNGLTFGYRSDSAPVIRDLTLTIAEGEHVAVVGPSGAGKSTLAHLLAGLLNPDDGEITIGDARVGDLHPRPEAVTLLPQQAYVFTGSLRENLTYLAPDATGAEVEQAAVAIGLDELIDRVGGIDAPIATADAPLSEADRQLIALARVYLCPAPVLILDEATCFLGPAAEARAEAALRARGGTLIVIAHRMSSARRADRILHIDADGARLGTHDQLLCRAPRYRELVGHWNGDMI